MERRHAVYEAYWHLASERQQIFERRLAGDPAPWTADPILARYKFTNPWRASDRVSQFLIKDVIYSASASGMSADDQLARIVFFRLFSKPATWQAIESELGPLGADTLLDDRLPTFLDGLRNRGPLYTGAFILCANNAYGFPRKHLNHIALVQDMLRSKLPSQVVRSRRLSEVYNALVRFPLIGPFMGYQLAIDINYSELVDFSEDEFTVPGPGAERGIEKVFPGTRRADMPKIIHQMVDEQEAACAQLGISSPALMGRRRLSAIDCQNLFCELDKYARVKFPELVSNRTRIKSTFSASSEPLSSFYPPKWGLNTGANRDRTRSTFAEVAAAAG